MKMKIFFPFITAMLLLSQALQSQTAIPVGPQQATFSSMVRGYHFTAPTNFIICGLYIPTDASTAFQNVEVVRFTAGAPPAYTGTTNAFVSLFYQANWAPNTMIPCSINVNAGDVIGVYGARGSNMVNSYGAANYVSNIGGFPVTFSRSGMQANLSTQQMANIWSEVNAQIGRIIMYYQCCTPPNPIPPIQGDSVMCTGDTKTYTVDTVGVGVGPTTYAWSVPSGATILSGQGSNSITVQFNNATNNDSLCVSATNSCTTVERCFRYKVDTIPVINSMIQGPGAYCEGDSGNYFIFNVPNATSYTWSVNGQGTITSGQGTINVTAAFMLPGVHQLCVEASNACGTSDTICRTIVVSEFETAITGNDTAFCGFNGLISANAPVNGTGIWTQIGGIGSTQYSNVNGSITNTTVNAAGIYTYVWTITNGLCVSSDTIQVSYDEMPVLFAGQDRNSCGLTYTLTASDPNRGTAVWSLGSGPGTATFASPTVRNSSVTVDEYGIYNFIWTATNGMCVISDTVAIRFDERPVPFAGNDTTFCAYEFNLFAQSNTVGTGKWTNPSPSPQASITNDTLYNSFVSNVQEGEYTFRWTLTNGSCPPQSDVVQITVRDPKSVKAEFTKEPEEAFAGEEVVFTDLSIGSPSSWYWNFGDENEAFEQNPVHTYAEGGLYEVLFRIKTDDGCVDSILVSVDVSDKLIVPNVITPNGDGINDRLILKSGGVEDFSLIIYNRSGRKVFETKDINNWWDGKSNGKLVSTGTYFYNITIKNRSSDEVKVYTGSLSVFY